MMKSLGLGTKYLITRIFLALGDSISFFWLFRALQIFRKFDFQNATPAVIPNQTFIKSCILTKLSFPINIYAKYVYEFANLKRRTRFHVASIR